MHNSALHVLAQILENCNFLTAYAIPAAVMLMNAEDFFIFSTTVVTLTGHSENNNIYFICKLLPARDYA